VAQESVGGADALAPSVFQELVIEQKWLEKREQGKNQCKMQSGLI
jgi:hypothetical protein